jgi:hypothetical protein
MKPYLSEIYFRLDDRDEFLCDRCNENKMGGWFYDGEQLCNPCVEKRKQEEVHETILRARNRYV